MKGLFPDARRYFFPCLNKSPPFLPPDSWLPANRWDTAKTYGTIGLLFASGRLAGFRYQTERWSFKEHLIPRPAVPSLAAAGSFAPPLRAVPEPVASELRQFSRDRLRAGRSMRCAIESSSSGDLSRRLRAQGRETTQRKTMPPLMHIRETNVLNHPPQAVKEKASR
jgi:hypothetical protein